MKKQYLECGKIVTTHGIVGEVKVQPWCDSVEELEKIKTFFLDEGKTALEVQHSRSHKNMALIKLKGYDNIEQAQLLRGKVIWADRSDFILGEHEYFIQDLIGVTVVDADDGHAYGTLCDVSKTGANDVYHVTFADGTVRLIPVIPQVVISTDIDAGIMRIRPLKGLFDDED